MNEQQHLASEQVEIIDTGEAILRKARTTARRIARRVWAVMGEPDAPARPRPQPSTSPPAREAGPSTGPGGSDKADTCPQG